MISLAVNAALAFYGAVFLAGLTPAPPPDPFSRALSFALTGRDNATVRPVDWATCTFEANGALFRIGAVDPSRLAVALTEYASGWGTVRRATVALHGDGPVYERTELPLDDESPMDDADIRVFKHVVKAQYPELFTQRRIVLADHTVTLATTDVDRVRRAWAVVIRGCATPHGP